MPRLLFTIAADASGWQLYEGQFGRDWFDNLGDATPRLEQVEAIEAPGVTHVRYARVAESR